MTLCSRRIAALVALVCAAAACSGGDAPEVAAPVATTIVQTTSVPSTIATATSEVVAETTIAPIEDPPASLAFASSRDLGRLYTFDSSEGEVFASLEAAGVAEIGPLPFDQTVVALSAKSREGELWVLVGLAEEADSPIGWVQARTLVASTEIIESFLADNSGQFRRVVGVRSSSFLNVRAAASVDSDAVGQLGPNATFMHGGYTAMGGDGEEWVDVVDEVTGERIGWVLERFAALASGLEAQTAEGVDVARRADRDTTYGGAIGSADITALGCNAAKLALIGSDPSLGTGILFGTSADYNSETNRWALSGGGDVWLGPGDSLVLTLPRDVPNTWYLLAVDATGTAVLQPSLDGGVALAPTSVGDLISFDVAEDYCGTPVVAPEFDDGAALDVENSGDESEPGAQPTTQGATTDDPASTPDGGGGGNAGAADEPPTTAEGPGTQAGAP